MIRTFVVKNPSVWYLVATTLLSILWYIVVSIMRQRRESSALKLAPAVYLAGGDPADVLRAVDGKPAAPLRRIARHSRRMDSPLAAPPNDGA
jgi:hypothetical protein